MSEDQRGNSLKAVLKQFGAGGAAGAVSRTVVSPLERVKILLQLQGRHLDLQLQKQYTGVWQSLRHIWQKEGILGYYKGNGSNVVRIIPYTATQFMVYEQLKIYIGNESTLTYWPRFFCGAAAGIVSVICTYPLDIVRTRLSASSELFGGQTKYKGMFQGIVVIAREEGIRGMYKGAVPTSMGVAPYVGLNFSLHEIFKKQFGSEKDLNFFSRVLSSGASGAIAQTFTYPFDVIRRKMQMQGTSPHYPVYHNTRHCLSEVYKYDGIGGFYRGLWPNMIKVVPSVAAAFITFDYVTAMMHTYRII